METVYIYTCIIVIFLYKSTAEKNQYGNLCLETARKFVNKDNKCKFKEKKAAAFFKADNSTCLNTCEFEMINVHNRKMKNLKFNFTFDAEYKLLSVCTKQKADSVENVLNIKCVSWMKDYYRHWESGVRCSLPNAECVRINTFCVCHCMSGYFIQTGNCLKANIKVNESCVSDKQCTGTTFARNCSGGLCSCQDGFILLNNTCHQEYKADSNNKSLLGVIVGGPLAGAIIVTLSAFLIYKRLCRENTSRKEPVIHSKINDTNRVDDHATPLRENKQENVANKSPYDHSEESVDYCHIYDETRDALTQDDVYHHLNEEEQKQDDSNCDHASAAVGHVTDLNEYSVISDIKTDETMSPTEENDEYFVLEQSFSKDG
ncbi:uncharacterized protein [Magallana gigas]|uniref:uncharacterized protein isoform X2 n=1 Tax=Magallana gigas TaxID=29159 RepID=UPI00334210EB